jgi:hypothetical protein
MNGLPSSAVAVTDGEITIDAALLAPKLGLTPEALQAAMREGYVYSFAEKGESEDEGRIRLTFRYRARTWAVIVNPDGTLLERATPALRTDCRDLPVASATIWSKPS